MDAGKVGLFTTGLWALRREVAVLTGLRPTRRFWSGRGLAAVAGWGHKPTAARARKVAARTGLPYLALEDGFLRSVGGGPDEPSLSYVCDPVGIYYDGAAPSALEALVRTRVADPSAAAAAAPALRAVRELGLSKYNAFELRPAGLEVLPADPQACVLALDQTAGDAAVIGAGADAARFSAMLAAAVVENPDRVIVVRTHPEVEAGRRRGCLDLAAAARSFPAVAAAMARGRILTLAARAAPAAILARVGRVYVVSSLMGLEALIHGRPVACFGWAFYAGWGLTEDRAPPPPGGWAGRRGQAPLPALVAAAYLDYATYFGHDDRKPCGIGEVVDFLDHARRARMRAGA